MSERAPILPAHIEDTVQAIARLHADHYSHAKPLQKFVDRLTAGAGRPVFVGILTAFVAGWIGINLVLAATGREPFDEPPFPWLGGLVALAGLYMAILILVTQRREDQLASQREQLTLELSILAEQKAAKIIAMLEEIRRDNPDLPDRVDGNADAMSKPADPESVLEAIRETHGATRPDLPQA